MAHKSILDSKPEVKYLPMEKLYIPVKYQRALAGKTSLENMDYIKNNFNWAACGALLVCKIRKDAEKYAVIDGQHRFKGAELRGDIDELPCIIISPRDIKEQAQIFIDVNTRRQSLSTLQYYRAALAAGNTAAETLNRICQETQVVIPTYALMTSQAAPDIFQSVGMVLQLLKTGFYTEAQVKWSFEVIRESFPQERGAFRFSMVRALMEWAKKYPKGTKEEMVRLLSGTTVRELDIKARTNNLTGHHRTVWRTYIEILERQLAHTKKKAA